MRGGPDETKQLFSYVDIEDGIASQHSLRANRALVEEPKRAACAQRSLSNCTATAASWLQEVLQLSFTAQYSTIGSRMDSS